MEQYRYGSQALATASMILGVCSFLFMLSGGFLLFGSLGILLAILSRGSGKMSTAAKAGLGASIAGILIGTAVVVTLFSSVIQSDNLDHYLEDFEDYYEYYLDDGQTPPSGTNSGNML